uniref:NADP-dependent oxidoreductase domain-containing protein n=1 Tax=Bionectria ochroleuca TaxID=29856 RepID=A0A8H7K122_BIOOC
MPYSNTGQINQAGLQSSFNSSHKQKYFLLKPVSITQSYSNGASYAFHTEYRGQDPSCGLRDLAGSPGQVEKAVEAALRCGYKHIDCAAIYRNEVEVGEGIRKSGVPRSEIFITGKLWNTKHAPEDVEGALDKSLKDLGVEYLDLYLMHWPVAFKSGDDWFPIDSEGVFELADIDPATTYTAMEKLLQTGKVKAIGVSNFNKNRLDNLISKTTVVPAVNQIEVHPYFQQPEFFKYCQSKGIQIGEPRTVDDPLVAEIAKKIGLDIGQVLYSWGVQRGHVVLPKSVTPSRIESNLQVHKLPDDIFEQLNGMERNKRLHWQSHWGFDIFGEVGEAEVKRIAKEAGPANLKKFGK